MGLTTKQYIELHKKFRKRRSSRKSVLCELLDYSQFEFPSNSYQASFLMVVEDTKTSILEVLNWSNQFAITVEVTALWAQIVDEMNDVDLRLSLMTEIVAPIAFYALSFPAAIRGKIVFGVERMFRDTFDIKKKNNKKWEDHQLLESNTDLLIPSVEIIGARSEYNKLVQAVAEIDAEDFRKVTDNYRNRANHQITPCLEIGERLVFQEFADKKSKGYSFGIEKSLKLSDLIDPLIEQQQRCRTATDNLWTLCGCLHKHWAN